ncbi:MAG: chorismate synthase, partial [Chloroflexi bacterium]|nr:chorismate synthase [Chloroflexota bacterium]
AAAGVTVWSGADQLGPIRASPDGDDPLDRIGDGWWQRDRLDPTPLRCPDPAAEAAMMAEVDAVIEAGDSIGGSFVVVVEGMPIGVGSNAEWDTRLDTALAAATMGIQAVKGVEIGLGFGVLSRRGSMVHDEVDPSRPSWGRRSNRAGGVEGGMSNGEAIVVRAAVKPVATLRKPLDAVDLATGQSGRAHIERSDVAILPRAAVVGEAMISLVIADALLATFGGDTMGDVLAAVRRRRARSRGPRGAAPSVVMDEVSSLPDDAASEATPISGVDA